MRMNGFGCPDDFLVGSIQLPVSDIISDRTGEQEVILCHDAHLTSQTLNGNILYIVTVNGDGSLLYVIKAADQIDDRCFSGACRPYKCNCFSRFDIKADIV